MSQTVLVINSGSSSIKYQLVDPETGEAIAKGLVERIGDPVGKIKHTHGDDVTIEEIPIADHEVGMREVLRLFDDKGPKLAEAGIVAVGHRIVQGGKYFDGPAVINDEVRNLIEELCPMAPLHNPAHLKGIDVARELMPEIPHVAVFDTAFFQALPEKAYTYALNAEVAEKYAVRRYGAHGTSHQFVSREVAKYLGRDDLKQIVMHLGNGASVSAVLNGKPIDTSMGLTPLEGLMMGTRTGDIDPAVVFHLARQGGMTIDEIDTLFNKQSGMKGLTGESDMRSVWEMIFNDDDKEAQHKARVAMDVYINRLLKYVGSYTAELGGLDVITFTAGIGENDWDVRKELAQALEPFGVKIDLAANDGRIGEPRVISTPDSKVTLLVYPTNEEFAIARLAREVI
ncbi:MAG: acetate/propionate family kinase [Schaalia turicensis]|uniref:acetate/propionate family kinase n=1 Tax=unclassified Pauljensenia TaxID=2908895 RepID=UPI0015C980D8|nr:MULTISPECIES: acetate kinase [unclassified Pauljensenia]MDK6400063.1 acetate kinase [Pauljensenia sp. UMB9872]MDK7172654.1 acetate kinase [Pauljensenia sp. UMB1235]